MSRVMLITGASRGIGAATARLAAQQGYALCLNYHQRADAANAVLEQVRGLGVTAIAVKADVADEAQVLHMFDVIDREFGRRLLVVRELVDLDPREALAEIGTSPMVWETVPAAFYCHLKLEPEEALIAAASSGGDTDSIASIAGALAGASRGSGWIPERWFSCLEERGRIEEVATGLADVAARICPGI